MTGVEKMNTQILKHKAEIVIGTSRAIALACSKARTQWRFDALYPAYAARRNYIQ